MQQVANAYARTAQSAQSPKELESSLLLKAGMKLQSVKDRWPESEGELFDTLNYNRRLWTILVSSVAKEDNPLPREIKQNIINLGMFIFNHSIAIQFEPDPKRLAVLVNINRDIAAGLRGRGTDDPEANSGPAAA